MKRRSMSTPPASSIEKVASPRTVSKRQKKMTDEAKLVDVQEDDLHAKLPPDHPDRLKKLKVSQGKVSMEGHMGDKFSRNSIVIGVPTKSLSDCVINSLIYPFFFCFCS